MRKFLLGLSLAAGMVCAAGAAQAATFYSGDADTVCAGGLCGPLTIITPHGDWGDVSDNAGMAANTAQWISYADTGLGGITAPDVVDRTRGSATAVFTQSFSITEASNLNLWVLTDDTVTVDITGPGGTTELFAAFLGQINPCAGGGTGQPVGCVEADMGELLDFALASAGDYTLTFYGFQTNQVTFGTQYAGNVTTVVPEPATWGLMISGFAFLGFMRRRSIASARA